MYILFRKILFSLLIGGPLVILVNSCELINPAEDIPSFIHIDSIDVKINNPSAEGTGSHKISDAWVYVDDELIGAFELPATVPILKEGTHRLTIRAGIKSNGISSTRPYYPFYEPVVYDNFKLYKDSIIKINPVTHYSDGAKIAWIEGFEDGGVSLINASDDTTSLNKTNDHSLVFEGNYSAYARILPGDTSFFFRSTDTYKLPISGYSYLELNYKNNNKFVVGLIANINGTLVTLPVLVLNRSDNWNKIYINLTMMVYNYSTATDFYIFVSSVRESDVAEPLIYLDNLKLVYSK
jgi:hypothetical protein